MIGKTVSHFRIVEKLGEGGMGVVYKAEDLRLERFAALKFLPSHLNASEEEKQRFIHEAKAASALDHNNICTIYEIAETEDDRTFISMAYYDGGCLKQKIEQGVFPVKDAVDMAMQIAQGLAKAHERGIFHRDIKPANVMLTSDGVAKIVDFGLAKLTCGTKITNSGTTMGTPAYMSPEQATNTNLDHRTDIWALGVVLFEMLTARVPFQGEKELIVLYKIINEKPEPIHKYRPEIPDDLLHVIDRALQKSPKDRYPAIDDMLLELHAFQAGGPRQSQKTIKEQQPQHITEIPTGDRKATATLVSDDTAGRAKAIELSGASLKNAEMANLAFTEKLQYLATQALEADADPKTEAGSNPYLNRLMIRNPDHFLGRRAELSRIYERIKAGRPQSISLVGIRRIGKSSLLNAIHHPANRKAYLPTPQEYVFVFMDLQEKRNVEPDELMRYIFNALQKEFQDTIQLKAKPGYEGLKEIVQTFQDAGLKLIFLWDEFECVTRNPHIGPEFYAYFRALANNFNVAYITTSSAQLQNLCHTKEIADSPFFNIFTNLHLGPFNVEEAKKLIAEPSARAGKPLAQHGEFVLEIAGCFPFFIQIACSALFSLNSREKVDYKKVREDFMEEAGPHFQEFWDRFDESQQVVVSALAWGRKPPREHALAIKNLAQAGFVLNGKLFSTLFAEFVREKIRSHRPWWKVW
jgi:hypothetical protein